MIDPRLLKETRQQRCLLLLLVALGAGGGLLAVVQAHFFAKVIDAVFLKQAGRAAVAGWMGWLLLIMLGRSAVVWLVEHAGQRLAAAIKQSLRQRVLGSLQQLGPVHCRQEETGELVHVLTEGIEGVEPYFNKFLPQLCTAVLVPLLVLIGFVAPLDWGTAVLLCVTAPLIPIFMVLIGRLAEEKNRRQWETLSRLSAHFLDVLQGLTTLKLFGRSVEQVQVIARMSREFRHTTLGVLRVAFLSAFVLELTATISTALVAVTVGLRLLYGHMEFYDAFFLLLLAPEFYLPLRMLGTQFHAGMAGKVAADRIYAVLTQAVEQPPAGTAALPRQAVVSVAFQGVRYAYTDDRVAAVQDVSFQVAPGERVAFVGGSGAGKSTVAALLLGLVRPAAGQITLNGYHQRAIAPADWQRQMAFVPQAPHVFSGSIADNIRLASPEASAAAVEAAAAAAGAHDFICALPDGYATLVGEGGRSLSGGEAKRLAIARAFLQDAPLLILDEATAGLDLAHEAQVEAAIDRLMEGRTVIIMAHRLTTVYRADRIIVLRQGAIAESGSHQELLAQQGEYAALVQAFRGEL